MALPDIPDKSMVDKILSDINLNEKNLEIAVATMKQWLIKQPHLPPAAADELWLKAFIIGCKSVEKAKIKLDTFFTYRLSFKSLFFADRDPLTINWKSCEASYTLPGMTPEGYKVILITLPTPDEIDDYSMEETSRVSFMKMDLFCREHYMSSGLIFVNDLSNLSVEFTLKSSLANNSAVCKILQEAYPFRVKAFIAINAPSLAETFFNTFIKPFFTKKLKNRMFIYSEDHNAVKNHFPIEMLPCDYSGGTNPSKDTLLNNTRKQLESQRDWLLSDGSQCVDESLRQKDDDTMKGTFRKLEAE